MDLLGSLVGIAHFGLTSKRDLKRRDESNEHRLGGKKGHLDQVFLCFIFGEHGRGRTRHTGYGFWLGTARHAAKGSLALFDSRTHRENEMPTLGFKRIPGSYCLNCFVPHE